MQQIVLFFSHTCVFKDLQYDNNQSALIIPEHCLPIHIVLCILCNMIFDCTVGDYMMFFLSSGYVSSNFLITGICSVTCVSSSAPKCVVCFQECPESLCGLFIVSSPHCSMSPCTYCPLTV